MASEVRARALRPRNRQLEALTAETITNLNPLTPLPILRLFRPAGRLDALANCTALTDLNLLNCSRLEGQSYARSASLYLLALQTAETIKAN